MALLYLARKYMLPEVVDDCVKLAKKFVNKNMVWLILEDALRNHEETIRDACLTFIRMNTREVIGEDLNHVSVPIIPRSTLEYVLENAMLNVEEEAIFQFCLQWARLELQFQDVPGNAANIREQLGPCLFKIQFQLFNVTSFTEQVAMEGLLDDETILQFYKCIGLGKDKLDPVFPAEFEMKQRPNERVRQATVRDRVAKGRTRQNADCVATLNLNVCGDHDTLTLSCVKVKTFRRQYVDQGTRELDCFYRDKPYSVKVDGVGCLEMITYEMNERDIPTNLSPQPIYVLFHLKPEPIHKGQEYRIEFNFGTRLGDEFMVEGFTEDYYLKDDENKAVLQIQNSPFSPVESIKYLVAQEETGGV